MAKILKKVDNPKGKEKNKKVAPAKKAAPVAKKPIQLAEVVVSAKRVKPKASRDSVTYTGNYDTAPRYKEKPQKVAIKDLVSAEGKLSYGGKNFKNANAIQDSSARQRAAQGAIDSYGVGPENGGNTEAIMRQFRKDKSKK